MSTSLRILIITPQRATTSDVSMLSRVLLCAGHTPYESPDFQTVFSAQPGYYHAILVEGQAYFDEQWATVSALPTALPPLCILDANPALVASTLFPMMGVDMSALLAWLAKIEAPQPSFTLTGLYLMIYGSYAVPSFSERDLLAILSVARDFNEKHGITGTLLYNEGRFMQVLEGEYAVVNRLFYEKIISDKRHTQATILCQEFCHARAFSDWHMGFFRTHPNDFNLLGATDLNTHPAGHFIKDRLSNTKSFIDFFL